MDGKVKDSMVNKAKEMRSSLFNFPQIDSKLAVWFIFEGKEYEVAHFNISFSQYSDYKGQPQDEVRGGIFNILLSEILSDELYQWAMTSSLRECTVEFRSETSNNPLKIEFFDAYCMNMERVIDVSGGLNTTLVISPKELKINGMYKDNNWV